MTLSVIDSMLWQIQSGIHKLLWLTILVCLCVVLLWLSQKSHIPTINSYPGDILLIKARKAFKTDAKRLISSGLTKFNGPFRIITTQGSRIILPSSYTEWAKSCKELDHQALIHDDYFADYSGFDGQAVVTNPDRILIDVPRTKLSQNAQSIQVMHRVLEEVLPEIWTDEKDWHHLNWPRDTMSVISRMSASIFVGPELAHDPEWQHLTTSYTVNLFTAVGALRQWPSFLRPFVHRFLPQSMTCRTQMERTRQKLQAMLKVREQQDSTALAQDHHSDRREDAITWFEEVAAGRSYDPAAAQLALAISALHTTSEAFRQVLLDVCLHPDLLEPMRREMELALSESGWTLAALAKMQLVDSVMKESQRFKPGLVGIERKAIRDTTLPDGTKIPRGSIISVDSSDMWNADIHENPQEFDGYRFLRMRQQGGKAVSAAQFASSTKEHNTFGAGKFICPGRFFVANEMKLALTHVMLKYDMRLKDGRAPQSVQVGFYPSTDLTVEVEVRRRDYNLVTYS